jgi:hypothetical protein
VWEAGGGFAALPLVALLGRDGFFARAAAAEKHQGDGAIDRGEHPLAPKASHFPSKARKVVFLFMNGAPSHVDTFDPKPELEKHHGTPYQGGVKVGSNDRPIGHLMKSPFPFKNHGASGLPISSLFPHTAKFADDLCVLRGLYTDTAAHASGCLQMNTGFVQIGRPSLGAWLSYGLGSECDNLPAFVVMTDPRGGPIGGASNWTAGYMPAAYQGTLFRSGGAPLLDLATPAGLSRADQRRDIDLIAELNGLHQRTRAESSELAARIESYELAFKMQSSALDVVDVDREPAAVRAAYGIDEDRTRDFGRKCLIARRLLEKGVRFIQIYSGGGHLEDTWDGHTDCITNHKTHAGETDQPIGAFLADLKRTGLWDETLVVWGGEFGRTPTSEGVNKPGRDHNPHGFSMWLAGAGVRGGQAVGGTDELGFRAVEERAHISDFHATILHLLGLDHTKLTYFHGGRDQRLTDVRGRILEKVLA